MTDVKQSVAAALGEFAKAYAAALRGDPFTVPPAAQPLASVVTTPACRWRPPHPLVVARQFLDHAVNEFVRATPRTRVVDPEAVARVVRLAWGVDGHPISIAHAFERLSLPANRSAERWPHRVAMNSAVQRFVAATIATAPPPSRVPIPAARGRTIRALPDDALLRAERHLQGAFDLVPLLADSERHDLIVDAVRSTAASRVGQWFGEDTPYVCDGHLRWFKIEAAASWWSPSREPLLTPPVGMRRPTGKSYAAAVQAAWMICLFDAADDAKSLQKYVKHRLELLDASRVAIDWIAVRSILDREVERSRPVDGQLIVCAPTGVMVPPSPPTGAEGLTKLAAWSRTWAGTENRVARGVIVEYLGHRSEILEQARSRREQTLIAVSDHSIHWDTVVMECADLELRVRNAIRLAPARARWGYLAHTWRAPALLYNKRNDWTGAASYALAGLTELFELTEDGRVRESAEFYGAAEQLWLALAGVSLRKVEWLLASPATEVPRPVMAQWCRVALAASGQALACVATLDETDELFPERGDGLPVTRHVDGRIDSKAWWARALIVRLRSLLGVKTAVGAGLVDESDVFAEIVDGNRALPLLGLTPTSHDRDSLDMAYLRELYRTLIKLPTLSAGHLQEVATIALWLALFDEHSVPVDAGVPPIIASGLPFLTAENIAQHRRVLDIGAFVQWLSRDHAQRPDQVVVPYDAWVLSWLPQRVAAARYLDRASGTLFHAFRSSHDNLRPSVASHD